MNILATASRHHGSSNIFEALLLGGALPCLHLSSALLREHSLKRMTAILRALFGYYFLVFMMRVAGRRPGKQLTPADFLLVFFSGGLVLTAVVSDDRSVLNSLSQIVAIALAHYALVVARQMWPQIGRIVDGTPLVLLNKGEWKAETMKAMHIQPADVMAIARDQGLSRLEQIDYAVLERNGQISILPKHDVEK